MQAFEVALQLLKAHSQAQYIGRSRLMQHVLLLADREMRLLGSRVIGYIQA